MPKVREEKCTEKRTASVGSRQAVEAAIDASKASQTQTWEAAGKASCIPPWKQGDKKKDSEVED